MRQGLKDACNVVWLIAVAHALPLVFAA